MMCAALNKISWLFSPFLTPHVFLIILKALPENSVLSCHKKENQHKVLEKLNHSATMEWHRVIKTNNKYIENAYSPINIPNRFFGAKIITKDVTERERYLERLKKNSETDPLTGLYNRNLFISMTILAMKKAIESLRKLLRLI